MGVIDSARRNSAPVIQVGPRWQWVTSSHHWSEATIRLVVAAARARQLAVPSARSSNPSSTRWRSTCAKPNERTPGVNHRPAAKRQCQCFADVDVWRPRPVDWFTPPVCSRGIGDQSVNWWTSRPPRPNENRHPIAQVRSELVEGCHRVTATAFHVEVAICRKEFQLDRRGQLSLAPATVDTGIVSSRQAPVDQADPRRGIRNRNHNPHLIDIGYDDPFVRDRSHLPYVSSVLRGSIPDESSKACLAARTSRQRGRRHLRP